MTYDEMTFGDALDAMRNGRRVQRAGWNGKGMWLRLVGPRDGDRSRIPDYPCAAFIEMKTADAPPGGAQLVPWLASQTDVLAADWRIVSDEEAWEIAVRDGVTR